MTELHPVHYLVTVTRNTFELHAQLTDTKEEAEELREKFAKVPHAEVTITEIHDPAETDLTTHTRELIENL